MKAKHTPGPWFHGVPQFATPFRFVRDAKNTVLAYVEGSRETAEANGKLIAAAPDLLDAAEEVEAAIQGLKLDAALKTATNKLYAAACKARGTVRE